jgi:hypothetical protein
MSELTLADADPVSASWPGCRNTRRSPTRSAAPAACPGSKRRPGHTCASTTGPAATYGIPRAACPSAKLQHPLPGDSCGHWPTSWRARGRCPAAPWLRSAGLATALASLEVPLGPHTALVGGPLRAGAVRGSRARLPDAAA